MTEIQSVQQINKFQREWAKPTYLFQPFPAPLSTAQCMKSAAQAHKPLNPKAQQSLKNKKQ
ncbi:hypothetical protein LguiA_036632 [Lonicera macranthoides]